MIYIYDICDKWGDSRSKRFPAEDNPFPQTGFRSFGISDGSDVDDDDDDDDDGDHKGNESDDGEMMMKVMMMTMKVMMLKMIYDHSIRKPTIFRWGQYVDRLTQDADKAFSC